MTRSMPALRRLSALILLTVACAHVPTEREQESARIRYDLALERQRNGDAKEAYEELEKSLALDPSFPEAHNAKGLLLHLAFGKHAEAIASYRRALELNPKFSEVRTNLGNVHLDQGRYAEAIAEYDLALADMLYVTPFFAQGNRGWALYKSGQVEAGIEGIKAAVGANPGFCQGFRNLGTIYQERGDNEEALRQYRRFREACPEVPEAYQREGAMQALLGLVDEARNSFALCEAKSSDANMKDDCRRLADKLQ
jgi:Tfp pilus assembly protein PilF